MILLPETEAEKRAREQQTQRELSKALKDARKRN
jgi:hypothetical protein